MTELENFSSEEINQNQLLDLLEELQTENERYQTQIQQLSSEKQELVSTVQQQKKKIAEQAELIEKLNESDKELLQSRKNLREAEQRLKEAENFQDKAEWKAAAAERKLQQAERESYEARLEKQRLQQIIDSSVKNRAEQIDREKTAKLEIESEKHFIQVGSVTVALSAYCVIMTALWLSDRWETVKTVPQWFVNRLENIKAIWGGVVSIYEWAYKLLQPHMAEFLAKAIPIVVMIAIVGAIGYFVAFKGIVLLADKWGEPWRHYEYQRKKLLKVSMTIAIVTVSIPLAVFLAEITKNALNVFSWWLIFAVALNAIYHAATYKRY